MITTEISFDQSTTTADAIQRAAYRLSDLLSLDLAVDADMLRCTVHVETDDEAAAQQATSEFRKEVLDQVLRERIRNDTEGLRNVILAMAFSNTGLTDDAD